MVLAILLLSFLISCSKDNCSNPNPNPINNKVDTVKIGNQVWMNKDLDVDHYRNGDPIPQVSDSAQWANLKTGAWCYYNNYPPIGAINGKLYNWYAVNDPRVLAPEGWHIPSDAEWTELVNYLGGDNIAGGKLREAGNSHWVSPNTGATNESGFTALPGGWRNYLGVFDDVGYTDGWLSSTEYDAYGAWYRYVGYDGAYIVRVIGSKGTGFSVRCVRD